MKQVLQGALNSYLLTYQAIVTAHSNPKYASLYEDMKAVVFLGTPHRGADLAAMLKLILVVSFSSRRFVEQLKPESDAIKYINENFAHRSKSFKLVSYFETENTGYGNVTTSSDMFFSNIVGHSFEENGGP